MPFRAPNHHPLAVFLTLPLVAVLGLSACSSPTPRSNLAPPGPSPLSSSPGIVQIALQPPPVAAPLGDIFPLYVLLDTGGQALQGVQVYLDYDPQVLRPELVTGVTGPNGDLVLTSDADDPGRIDLELRSSTGTIAAGFYPLATIVFTAVAAPPTTTVQFTTSGRRTTRAFAASGDLPLNLRDTTISIRVPPTSAGAP